jgi:hypothetical protein
LDYRLVNIGCILEVFDFKELVSWCTQIFDSKTRRIQVATEGKNLVVLTPKVFRRMLFLPSANKSLKLSEANAFLDSQGGGSNVLKDFLILSTKMPNDLSTIDISLLEELYQDFSWLFVIGWTRVDFPYTQVALYALYFSFHKDVIFDWA